MEDVELWKTIGSIIGGAGFPAFIATWFLVKTNGKLDRLAEAVRDNTEATRDLADAVKVQGP